MRHTLASGLVALALAAPASAQFYGGSGNYAPSTTQGFARGLSGSADQGGQLRSFSVSNNNGGGLLGGGGGGWGSSQPATPWSTKYGGWVQEANSGVLRDDVARQQAYFQGSMQNQDLEMRRMQLKRAAFDEMMYEKMNTPPAELVREEARLQALTRARNTPPEGEITDGSALNSLLTNISRVEAREGVRGYSIPLDPEAVKHLNVTTTGTNSGSNELFKPRQDADWPVALQTDVFAAERKKMHGELAAMVSAQLDGKVDALKANEARQTIGDIRSKLFSERFKVSFSDYSGALQGLTKLEDAVNILGKPGAKNFLDGTYAAKGNTVAELVDYMISKGLKFAPASPGFEAYYLGFYQSLVTYDISISRLVGDQSTMSFQPTPKKGQ
jgi:hypothetical protein